MTKENILFEDFAKIIADILEKDYEIINEETLLIDELNIESIELMAIIAEVENIYGIDITLSENFLDNCNRCGDFYQMIKELCKKDGSI